MNSADTHLIHRSHQFQRSIAVLIGIDDYHNGVPPLTTAVRDVRAVAAVLEQRHGYEVHLILDAQAALQGVRALLEQWLPQHVTSADRLLFYFAGHGVALEANSPDAGGIQGYLVPQDAHPQSSATFLPMSDLYHALCQLSCRHLLIILDCCFAGAFRWSRARDIAFVPARPTLVRERYRRYVQGRAWQAITSAGSTERANDVLLVRDERGRVGDHSPFALALLEALRGEGDTSCAILTATALCQQLRARVQLLTKDELNRQTPQLWPLPQHGAGEYLFQPGPDEIDLPSAPPLAPERNPYRGLLSFEERHSHLFFGRERWVERLEKAVHERPLCIVLGASGSGKSSLVQAGLLPRLRGNGWTLRGPLRPGRAPLHALAQAIDAPVAALSSDAGELARRLRAQPGEAVCLVVDQAEELLTLCSDLAAQRQFIALLAGVLRGGDARARVVLTLREDFAPALRQTELGAGWQAALFPLSAMTQDELRDAIERPTEALVLFFEPPTLVDTLINDFAQTPGALPLLSFTLSELYLRYVERGNQDRALRGSDYDLLGGVAGSMTGRATQELEGLSREDPACAQTVRRVLLRMVAQDGDDVARRRIARIEVRYGDDSEDQRVQRVLDRFSAARLLVQGQDALGEPYVEPAHDMLVRGWEHLQRWRSEPEEREYLPLQRQLSSAALDWDRHERQAGLLWRDNPRVPLVQMLTRSGARRLNQVERAFVTTSLAQRRRAQVLRGAAIAGLVALTGTAVVLGLRARKSAQLAQAKTKEAEDKTVEAKRQAEVARAAELEAQRSAEKESRSAKAARAAKAQETSAKLEAQRSAEAARRSAEAARRSAEAEALSAKEARDQTEEAVRQREAAKQALADRQAEEDEKRANRAILLADSDPGNVEALREALQAAAGPLLHPGQALTATKRQALVAAATAVGYPCSPLLPHPQAVAQVALSPDGERLFAACRDGGLYLWDTRSGRPLDGPRHRHEGGALVVVLSPDGRRALSAGADGLGQLWEPGGARTLTLRGHAGAVESAGFSGDGRLVVTASPADGTVRVWDAASGQPVGSALQAQRVQAAAFAPAGGVGVLSGDQVNLWDWRHGAPQRLPTRFALKLQFENGRAVERVELPLPIPFRFARAAAFSPDGRWLVTTRQPGMGIWVWALRGWRRERIIDEESGTAIAFSPDSQRFAVASGRGVHVLDRDSGARLISLQGHSGDVTSVVFQGERSQGAAPGAHSGARLATSGLDRTARLWSAEDPFLLRVWADARRVSLSGDGQRAGLLRYGRPQEVVVEALDAARGAVALRGHEGTVSAIALSETGERIVSVSAEDQTLRVWAGASGVGRVVQRGRYLPLLGMSPSGRLVVAMTADRRRFSAFVLAVDSGAQVALASPLLPSPVEWQGRVLSAPVQFSADEERVLVCAGGRAQVYDVRTGRLLRALGHGELLTASLSRDGQQVVAAGTEIVQRWQVDDTGEAQRTAHEQRVMFAALWPAQERMASAGADGRFYLWETGAAWQARLRFTLSRVFPLQPQGTGTFVPRRDYEAWAQLSADGRHVLILASETDREEAMASTRLHNATLLRRYPLQDEEYVQRACAALRPHGMTGPITALCQGAGQPP